MPSYADRNASVWRGLKASCSDRHAKLARVFDILSAQNLPTERTAAAAQPAESNSSSRAYHRYFSPALL